NKARRGELVLSLPVGLIRDVAGRAVKHPDQEVRERIEFVFATFLRVKSVDGVVRELRAAGLLLPRRERGRDDGGVIWPRAAGAGYPQLLRPPRLRGPVRHRPTPPRPPRPGRAIAKAPLASGPVAFHGPRQVSGVHYPKHLHDDPGHAARHPPGIRPP